MRRLADEYRWLARYLLGIGDADFTWSVVFALTGGCVAPGSRAHTMLAELRREVVAGQRAGTSV